MSSEDPHDAPFWDAVRLPNLRDDELRHSLEWVGLRLTDRDYDEYREVAARLFDEGIAGIRRILAEPDGGYLPRAGDKPRIRTSRRPTPADDPLNAIAHWCEGIAPTGEGLLSTLRIATKESIAIAEVPMAAGSDVLEHFQPGIDATVVRRILEAGGEIVATTNMDYLALSGGGDTSVQGPTGNPFDHRKSAGGSSGGSAACLSYASVDLSVGCDQGGSIRAPAAWCGVLGMKPTFGLVPYTGILGLDPTFDHCGPMARTVDGLARLLQVMAGPDDDDPRTQRRGHDADYVETVRTTDTNLHDLRVGVLEEGLLPTSATDPGVAGVVSEIAAQLSEMGAHVERVSVPEHEIAGPISNNVLLEGASASFQAGGIPHGFLGPYWEQAAAALSRGFSAERTRLSLQVQVALGLGAYLTHVYGGAAYVAGKAALALVRDAYDRALARVDVLLLPTVPWTAHVQRDDLSAADRLIRGWAMLRHTSPTNATGHPAISIPAGQLDGMPVGAMLIGRHYGESTLLRVARAFEMEHGWRPHPTSQTQLTR